MPLFYFHIRTPVETIDDLEGMDLPDLEAARCEAIDSLRSIIGEEVRHGTLGLDEWIEIKDRRGNLLLTVRSGDALSLARAHDKKEDTVVSLRRKR